MTKKIELGKLYKIKEKEKAPGIGLAFFKVPNLGRSSFIGPAIKPDDIFIILNTKDVSEFDKIGIQIELNTSEEPIWLKIYCKKTIGWIILRPDWDVVHVGEAPTKMT